MKIYNEKKFCFILCSNNEKFTEECLLYLSFLKIPAGYEAEVLTITDAESMASGYNQGMEASDARYKIYIHQDTFITEKRFLHKLLKAFEQDEKIGLVGMIGTEKLSKDGVMWHGERCGDFYCLKEMLKADCLEIDRLKKGIREVEAVDGLLIATREDIPWREDIMTGWDFYDVSQCLEFRRRGYKVVVPAQRPSWTIHACGIPNYENYNISREVLLQNYPEITQNNKSLRILFFHSNMIMLLGLSLGLDSLGHKVDISNRKISMGAYVEAEKEAVEEALEEGHYDLVVTYDFSQTVSAACQSMRVKYLAWVYDSPLLELYTKEAENSFNYICVFDKKQLGRMKRSHLKHLYYFPLASEVDCFCSVGINKKDERKYAADISFVGRLYGNRGYESFIETAEETMKREAEAIVHGTECIWDGKDRLFGKASDRLISYMNEKENKAVFEKCKIDKRYYFESLCLARKANEIERITILNRLAEQYRVVLYTDKKELHGNSLKNVKICPWIDYWEEMPKVFHLSKINLNISSRSIESGIPQRVFDVMAVGGFLLTNYQPEIEEYFKAGTDLEIYHSLDELMDKAAYYLRHPDIRVRIAINGYQKVKQYHSYEVRMKKVLKEICLSAGDDAFGR